MRIQDIMSTAIISTSPEASLVKARGPMKVGRVHHLIVEKDGKIVGVLSERDLGGTKVGASAGVVSDVMTEDVLTVAPETTIRQAANLLRGHSIGCLPVVDGERPVGIVTTTDLLELIGRGVEKPVARSTRWTLRDRGARRSGPSVRRERRG
jgi:acetoin utilization protein AcuB